MNGRIRAPWSRREVRALSLVPALLPATLLVLASCSSTTGGSGGPDEGTGGQDGSTTSSSGGSNQEDGSAYGGSSGSSGGSPSSGASSSSGGSSGNATSSSGSGGSSSGGASSSASSSSGGASSSSGSGSSGGSSGGKSSGGGSSSGSSGGKDAGSSGSSGGDATAEPACTTSKAVCTGNNSGCNVGSYYLYDNQWNCGGSYACGTESAYGCTNPDGTVAFVVNSNQPAGNTAVLTYPAMQDNFKSPTLSSFHTITATFEETSPHVGDYEVAWDCWFNNQAVELMIWVDNYNQTPGGSKVGSNVSLGGRTYNVFHSGSQSSGYIAFVATSNFTSGTVDLLEIFNYAVSHSLMPAAASTTVGQLSFGIEVCSTNGQNAVWTVNGYGITTN